MKEKKKSFKSKAHTSSKSADDIDDQYSEQKKWFDLVNEDPEEFPTVTEQILIELKDEAKKCHDSEVANYNIKNAKTNSNFQWMKNVMTKGTISDKIASHTIVIQNNPICNADILRNLVGMVKVGKKKECVAVIETLTDLFLEDLLKPGSKLKSFHQRPLSLINTLASGNAITRRKMLSAWYFEDQLKEIYHSFILALNVAAHDTVDSNKEKAISALFKLLAGNPEKEKVLLSYLVNKLGDPSQKVASKAIYCLGQLLHKHSNMQSVVLNEVEKLIFRSNVSTKSQYYGLCFLSQFYLNHEDHEVARRLIEVYFGFFKACIKKGDVDSRMMSALLMGVNRAYPYAKLAIDKISEHVNTIYRVVYVASFNVSLHALALLYQVSDCSNNITDRFYSALYKKMFDPQLTTTTHQAMLLSLIYKALLKDTEVIRVKALVKRLLQLSLNLQPNFACGVLYLVSQLIGKREHVQSLILKKSDLDKLDKDDGEDEKYHDTSEVNLEDEQPKDVDVTLKSDAPLEDVKDLKPDVNDLNSSIYASSRHHSNNKVKKENASHYNPLCRNPLHAGAEYSAYSELNNLRAHYHPTISLYSTNILNGETIKYSGDPLKDFTLVRFLDRFVFKNPKKLDDASQQGAHPTFGKRKMYQPRGTKSISVTSNTYLREGWANIPVDERFLYAYLKRKYEDKPMKNDDDDSDNESVASDEFEALLERMNGPVTKDIDDDLDYMNDIGQKLEKSVKKGQLTEDDDDEAAGDSDMSNEDSENDDEEFGELNEDDRELIEDAEDDDDEDIMFDESDEEDEKKRKTGKNSDITSLFASADEFATLLEDEGSSKVAPGSSNAFANKDEAAVKQISWEDRRDRWLSGYDQAMGKKRHKNFAHKGPKRSNKSTSGNQKKRLKS